MNKYDKLELKNQICFPLYVCSKEIIRKYTPVLKEFDLTYTQYITLMALWENKELTVNELANKLFLDSGTITPLLKKLEIRGLIKKTRQLKDERVVIVSITNEGLALRDRLLDVPDKIASCLSLEPSEAETLYKILNKLMYEKDGI